MLKKKLLDILCCPKCRGTLSYDPKKETLRCKRCHQTYPVTDEIPIMLVDDEAKK